MNTVKLIGNVGQDVDVKNFDTNKKVSFSLATNETYLNKNKEEVKETTWHNVVAWGALANRCETLIEKGKLFVVEGRISYRKYVNKENQTVRITEIVASKVEEFAKNGEVRV